MKNRLLALVALCGATSSTLPLWAADWADPELTFVKPDLDGIKGSPDKPGGLSIQLCKSEKKEFYIRYSS